ncbi:MAG: signal peptidase I [Oscillospiraceae bacterium]|nr:signal peptidase I [Oscillospiraceae bacterium]
MSTQNHLSGSPVQNFLINFLLIIAVFWILSGFIIGAVTAPNADMAPNIHAKDFLLYDRLEQDFHAQDVIVLQKNNTLYLGRIVAVGGDTVEITEQEQLVINNHHVSEPDIYSSTSRYDGTVHQNEIKGKIILVIRRNNF